ncbi:FMN reductase, partial [Nocardioides hankookensis]
FGVVGVTPTPYGGQWAHADAVRSAGIAGAKVVEDVTVSQSALEVDVLTDPDVLARLTNAVRVLVDYDAEQAAA